MPIEVQIVDGIPTLVDVPVGGVQAAAPTTAKRSLAARILGGINAGVRKAGGKALTGKLVTRAGGAALAAGGLTYQGLDILNRLNASTFSRPSFIPPNVHKAIQAGLGDYHYDILRGQFVDDPNAQPVDARDLGVQIARRMKGKIPSSQPSGPTTPVRRAVNLNALDNPDIPIERGTGVIRNLRTGRTFAVDARDTVNHQYDGEASPARITLPSTGFGDIDRALPGVVAAGLNLRQQRAAAAVQTAQANEQAKFIQALLLERFKQQAPTTKVLEGATPGEPPTVVTATPGGQATVQTALPPGQDLATLDARQRDLLSRRPDLLEQVNAQRAKYGLGQITGQ